MPLAYTDDVNAPSVAQIETVFPSLSCIIPRSALDLARDHCFNANLTATCFQPKLCTFGNHSAEEQQLPAVLERRFSLSVLKFWPLAVSCVTNKVQVKQTRCFNVSSGSLPAFEESHGFDRGAPDI